MVISANDNPNKIPVGQDVCIDDYEVWGVQYVLL